MHFKGLSSSLPLHICVTSMQTVRLNTGETMAAYNCSGEYEEPCINTKTLVNIQCLLVPPAQPSYDGCGLLPHHCPSWKHLLQFFYPMSISKSINGLFTPLPDATIHSYSFILAHSLLDLGVPTQTKPVPLFMLYSAYTIAKTKF